MPLPGHSSRASGLSRFLESTRQLEHRGSRSESRRGPSGRSLCEKRRLPKPLQESRPAVSNRLLRRARARASSVSSSKQRKAAMDKFRGLGRRLHSLQLGVDLLLPQRQSTEALRALMQGLRRSVDNPGCCFADDSLDRVRATFSVESLRFKGLLMMGSTRFTSADACWTLLQQKTSCRVHTS